RAAAAIGKPVVPFNCEGFRGVSQSAGHHVGNITLFEQVIGTRDPGEPGPYDINLIGEYNIRGDIWNIEPLFDHRGLGLTIKSRFTGNASFDELPVLHGARLNVLQCHRSSAYVGDLLKEKYGIPYLDVSLFGIEQTNKALREVAAFFGLEAKAEEVIGRETAAIAPEIAFYREKLEGKRVAIYQGGPRTWHWVRLMEELGMEVVVAATTFGHADDYEKIHQRVKDGTLIIDAPNALEIEEFLREFKVDLFVSGIKEKYLSLKLGVPFVNGHSYEDGAYAGYRGFVTFARDMYKTVCSPVWKLVRQPFGEV
ncbi:MAG TPA: nitrogenase molybdenum-iron protein subunit alpha, partial [Firmicutes bacterium]|nr:nitrogenase molybdenum-iron protein subunit alpha [Bacillota bacterium]